MDLEIQDQCCMSWWSGGKIPRITAAKTSWFVGPAAMPSRIKRKTLSTMDNRVESFDVSAFDASERPPYMFPVLPYIDSRLVPPVTMEDSSALSMDVRINSTLEKIRDVAASFST